MKNRFKYILIVLGLFTANVNADFTYSKKYVQINKIDLLSKVVYYTENGKSYKNNFSMELLEDVFYNSTSDRTSLSQLPLKKKYYIRLRSVVDKNNKDNKPSIYYIGTVPYPF